METSQPVTNPVYTPPPASPGIFASKVPSSVSFALVLLMFLLPLSEIRCGSTALMSKSGLAFATGQEWSFMGGMGKDMMKDMKAPQKGEKEGNSQYLIIGAAVLAILGLLLALAGSKTSGYAATACGVLGAGALIGFMIDLKKWFDAGLAKQAAEKTKEGSDSLGFDKMDSLTNVNLGFTPWFYIAVVAFLLAALFSYKRSATLKS
jgi:hypothetical protein